MKTTWLVRWRPAVSLQASLMVAKLLPPPLVKGQISDVVMNSLELGIGTRTGSFTPLAALESAPQRNVDIRRATT